MRDYGQVFCSLWQSKTVRAIPDDLRLIAPYLLSCPHSNMAGVFALPPMYAAHDLGWTEARVQDALVAAERVGFIERDVSHHLVRVVAHFRFNPIANENCGKKAFRIWSMIPACAIKLRVAMDLLEQQHIADAKDKTLATQLKRFVDTFRCTDQPSRDPSQTVEPVAKEGFGMVSERFANGQSGELAARRTVADGRKGARATVREPFANQEQKQEQVQVQDQDQHPLALAAPSGTASAPAKRSANNEAITTPTWTSYAQAYERVHGVAPARSAKANAQIVEFIKQVGADDAPAIAAHFLTMRTKWYREKSYPLGSLVTDAQAIRTSWITGRTITATEAQLADRTATNAQVFGKMLAEAEAAQTAGVAP
jgi:hypothetical protein